MKQSCVGSGESRTNDILLGYIITQNRKDEMEVSLDMSMALREDYLADGENDVDGGVDFDGLAVEQSRFVFSMTDKTISTSA